MDRLNSKIVDIATNNRILFLNLYFNNFSNIRPMKCPENTIMGRAILTNSQGIFSLAIV